MSDDLIVVHPTGPTLMLLCAGVVGGRLAWVMMGWELVERVLAWLDGA